MWQREALSHPVVPEDEFVSQYLWIKKFVVPSTLLRHDIAVCHKSWRSMMISTVHHSITSRVNRSLIKASTRLKPGSLNTLQVRALPLPCKIRPSRIGLLDDHPTQRDPSPSFLHLQCNSHPSHENNVPRPFKHQGSGSPSWPGSSWQRASQTSAASPQHKGPRPRRERG